MEDKLLKAKELKELLINLTKISARIHLEMSSDGGVMMEIHGIKDGSMKFLYQEIFHSYADDPQKCTLSLLRNFFSLPETAEHISSPHN